VYDKFVKTPTIILNNPVYTQLTNVVVGLRPIVYIALGIVSIILVFKGQFYAMCSVCEGLPTISQACHQDQEWHVVDCI